MLKDLPIEMEYNDSDHDIAGEFYLPCMEESSVYSRAVGFFSSSIYVISWESLVPFVNNGGKIRLLCSAQLHSKDVEALKEGYSASNEQRVAESLNKTWSKLVENHTTNKPAKVLAALVAKGVLEFKLAWPTDDSGARTRGIFHQKLGIFHDSGGPAVVFKGSMNETLRGLSTAGNSESIDVFVKWRSEDESRFEKHVNKFEELWHGKDDNVEVKPFPEVTRDEIREYGHPESWEETVKEIVKEIQKQRTNQFQNIASISLTPSSPLLMRTGETLSIETTVSDAAGNPLQSPNADQFDWSVSDPEIAFVSDSGEVTAGVRSGDLTVTAILNGNKGQCDIEVKLLRDHQETALQNWEEAQRRGILAHCTGSGKTYTAIAAIRDAIRKGEVPLVLVPSALLLTQWEQEIKKVIPDANILLCGDGHTDYKKSRVLANYTASGNSPSDSRIVLATMDTAATEGFQARLLGSPNLFLVADEVHRLGAKKKQELFEVEVGPRLGLSATPERYGDSQGTAAILNHFSGIVEPRYKIEAALKDGHLLPFYYHVHSVRLSEDEQTEYGEYTRQIAKLYATIQSTKRRQNPWKELQGRLELLQINRARIVKTAENKVDKIVEVMEKEYEEGQRWIIYCDNQEQLGTVKNSLQPIVGTNLWEYHSQMTGDRSQTLEAFETRGGVVVSIRCLDEGVNIPSVSHALVAASSQNPREFIQRRGRVLRKSPGLHMANIHDLLVTPYSMQSTTTDEAQGTAILKSEIARAIEFGGCAENDYSCEADLRNVAIEHDLELEAFSEFRDDGFENDEEEA